MTTRTLKANAPTAGVEVARPGLAQSWRRLTTTLNRWLAVSRQRRALARLDDRLLDDVGLDRLRARQESARPFWDL